MGNEKLNFRFFKLRAKPGSLVFPFLKFKLVKGIQCLAIACKEIGGIVRLSLLKFIHM